ncbi:MAG: hypothetical protein U5J82_12580 [Desulfobacterales bacterium]|nr:hypothetical protein [Desulfobacterales bacterium]
MSTRTQLLIYLIILGIFDVIIPVPITAMVLIHVLFQKPRWFKEWVEEILPVLMGFNGALPFFMVSPGVFTFAFTFASPAVSGAFRGDGWNGMGRLGTKSNRLGTGRRKNH